MWTTNDPSRNTPLQTYGLYSDSEVEMCTAKACKASEEWALMDYSSRAKFMKRLGELLKENVNSHARLISLEMGKPIKEARAEVLKCSQACLFFADNAAEMLKDEIIQTEALKSYVTYEPLGIILGIMPWNFPYWQVIRFIAPTLMAGNVVLLKHAPNVTGCSLALEKLLEEAGFPSGVYQALLIETDKIPHLLHNPHISAATVTGSPRAGASVAQEAGKSIKKTVLELGGSDPCILLNDADLEMLMDDLIKARMLNNGQSCIAAKRFYVPKTLHEIFCSKLIEHLPKYKIGTALEEDTDIGPLARLDLLENLERQVKQSIQMGAQLIYGGERIKREGFFYAPTVLTHVRSDMPVFKEESFGPVFAIIPYEQYEEAIFSANESMYGLGASIWSEDIELAEQLAKQLKAGSVFINSGVQSHVKLPFGGIKHSGYGRELSHLGIKEFVNIKTIYVK